MNAKCENAYVYEKEVNRMKPAIIVLAVAAVGAVVAIIKKKKSK